MTPHFGTRLRPGDVLEVSNDTLFGFLSYVGRHPSMGECVWVIPGLRSTRPSDLGALFTGPGYFAFYPATTATRRGLVHKIGFCAEAMRVLPSKVRYLGFLDQDGAIRSWRISDGTNEEIRTVLSPEELQLPIGATWNHPLLLERMETGWTPPQTHARF